MRSFNIEEGLIQMVAALLQERLQRGTTQQPTRRVLRDDDRVRQGCLLSPILFNIFLEKIMQEPPQPPYLNLHWWQTLCNLRFADDIDLMAGSNNELQDLTDRLSRRAGPLWHGNKLRKSKVMIISTTDSSSNIVMNGQKLEEVNSFKYLGATLTRDGCCTAESVQDCRGVIL
ncbi:hypothetical protein C0Q70_04189 [Pomacea canaliculata]|uniref:Reverse transcriptase domain-containing protein n=1 Tax=Pomacea canaliculata TaxID=400727 RepID=A0A2T7PUT9_POMCA|nr:hypothetical protein C0Q70_04189 [Pomacea canaliculata]